MERQIRPGEFYRHFKNKLYQIVAVAVHSETGEQMVVYQALYGDFKTYVRPYHMFAGEVDSEKYPDVKQKYRFERVEPGQGGEAGFEAGDSKGINGLITDGIGWTASGTQNQLKEAAPQPSAAFLQFLETDNYELRMECLKTLEQSASQTELDSICLVLDMKQEGGTVKEQVKAIERFLTMQNHFDGNRLR